MAIGCDLCDIKHRTPFHTASLQEEYIKEEQRSLKRELMRAQEEVKRIQAVPLVIGQFLVSTVANQWLATLWASFWLGSCLGHSLALPEHIFGRQAMAWQKPLVIL